MSAKPISLRLLRSAVTATCLSILGTVVLYVLARGLGSPLRLVSSGRTLTVSAGSVVAFSILGSLAGLVVAMMATHSTRPRTVFVAIAGAGTTLSLLGPMSAAPFRTAVWLVPMHLVVGAAALSLLGRSLPSKAPRSGVSDFSGANA